jgi:hypothetical protein
MMLVRHLHRNGAHRTLEVEASYDRQLLIKSGALDLGKYVVLDGRVVAVAYKYVIVDMFVV